MPRPVFPGRWLGTMMLVPASGLVLLAGVLPASAAVRGPAAPSRILQMVRPAAAQSITLGGDGATVKTSNGDTWALSVGDSSGADGLSIGLGRVVTAGGTGDEDHIWEFASTASSLTFSKTTGVGTVTGGTATGKVATIKLTFKATSHKAGSCSTGSETIYSGTLSGEAELVTGLSNGGTVGGKSVSFTAKGFTPQVIASSGCVTNTDECVASLVWSSGVSTGAPEAVGLTEQQSGKQIGVVSIVHEVKLSSPKGSSRTDIALVQAAAPTYNAKTGVLSVTSSSSGIVTGSATLSKGAPKTATTPCTFMGKTFKIKTTENLTASYASPAGKAITAHTALTGTLAAPSSAKDAIFIISTVS